MSKLSVILEGMRNGTLDEIKCAGNQIGDDGAKATSEALKINSTVHTIDLGGNQIGVDGAKALSEALKINSTVHTIVLYRNQIGDDGAEAICEALTTNSTVQTIGLGDNKIGDHGAKEIGELLKTNRTVHTIGLGVNRIGVDEAKALGEALKTNSTVQEIYLSDNEIGDDGAKAIGEALKANCTVHTITLRGNQIGDDGVEAICEALTTNSTVQTIGLRGNPGVTDKLRNQIDAQCAANKLLFEYSLARGASVREFREELREICEDYGVSVRDDWLSRTHRHASFLTALSCVRRSMLVAVRHEIVDPYLLATLALHLWWREHPFLLHVRSMDECYRLVEEKEIEDEQEVPLEDRWLLKWEDFVRVVQWGLAQCEDRLTGREKKRRKRGWRLRVKSGVEKEEYLKEMMN